MLRKTLLDLLQTDKQARASVWAAAEAQDLSDLNLDERDWRLLRCAGISPNDQGSCLLSLTMEYLLRLRIGAAAFNSMAKMVWALLDGCHAAPAINDGLPASSEPIVRADDVTDLSGLRFDSFAVPADITQRLRSLGIATWGQVAGLSEKDMLGTWPITLDAFLRVNDLWWLRSYVTTALKTVAPLQVGKEDGFRCMIEALLEVASQRPNDAIVFLGRMGLLDGRLWTLQELGERLGLTRERVRQIEQKVRKRLAVPRHRACIEAVRLAVGQVLRTSGGVCTYDEVGRGLTEVLRWGKTPPVPAMGYLLLSFGICECDRVQELAYDPFESCTNCQVAREALESLLSAQDCEIPVDEVVAGLGRRCRTGVDCGREAGPPDFSHGYVEHLLSSDNRFVVNNGTVYSRDAWRLRNGSRVQLIESIIKNAGKPMHFREVHDAVKSLLPESESITLNSVHATLTGADSVLLWDRGTFVYAGAVSIPAELVARIEAWLIDKLHGGVPFVSVTGAFNQFHGECTAADVASETALYTCLRKSANDELLYPKYPQVYLADTFESQVPAVVAIEQYLRDAGREVSMAELADYALADMCLKDFQFQQCIGQLSGILRTGNGGFIDASLVPLDEARLGRLKADVLRMVEREGHIAVTRVFDEKCVTCRMMGITSPEMLYSLLRELDYAELDLPSYPQIRLVGRGRKATEGRGIVAEVVSYIRQRGVPISFDELEDRYVEDLGYGEQRVHAAALADKVVRYGQGSVIHTEALAWSGEKQAHLERSALIELERSRECGWVHAMASGLLEGGDLPDLPGRVAWTQTLVCELLALERRFRVIGNARNAFVAIPNADAIESLDDLAAQVLSREFGGASALDAFEERLRQFGVIRRRLTATMLGEGSRVVASEHLVVLRELCDHA